MGRAAIILRGRRQIHFKPPKANKHPNRVNRAERAKQAREANKQMRMEQKAYLKALKNPDWMERRRAARGLGTNLGYPVKSIAEKARHALENHLKTEERAEVRAVIKEAISKRPAPAI